MTRRLSSDRERRLADLESATASPDPSTEWFTSEGGTNIWGEELSEAFAARGFIVIRQIYEGVASPRVIPSYDTATRPLSWSRPPPTASANNIRLGWNTPEAFTAAVEDAEARAAEQTGARRGNRAA